MVVLGIDILQTYLEQELTTNCISMLSLCQQRRAKFELQDRTNVPENNLG
jgi:hypothetical protein